MQFNGVLNKERLHSLAGQQCFDMCMRQVSTYAQTEKCWHAAITGIVFTVSVFVWEHVLKCPPPPSLPLFPLFTSVTSACPPFRVGAHGWVARICQPWERSPSRSWLPIVEAPGCLRHPTCICDAVVNL